MRFISSLNHEEVKSLVRLQTTKGRKQQNLFVLESLKYVLSAVESGLKLSHIYVTAENAKDAESMTDIKNITLVTVSIMNKISTSVTPSGLLAVFEIPKSKQYNGESALVLAQIQDPGNMGTLIRTASACNIKNIIVIDGCDIWSPKVIQSTAGAIASVDIFNWTWQDLMKNKGTNKVVGLVVKDGANISQIKQENLLFVVGNESKGIPGNWQKECDYLVTLDMPGQTESLNAAVAGSIALYIATVLNK